MSEIRPQVSVVIVTHNSLPALTDCLSSIKAAATKTPIDLIVVDNGSADKTVDQVIEQFAEARIIRNERNLGFAAACNQGAKSAPGEYLLFLNPDVQIDKDAIERLVAVTAERDQVGLVSGRLRFPDSSFQATCRQFPTIGNMIFSRGSVVSRLFADDCSQSKAYTLPDYMETTEVPAVAATMVMIRKDLFDKTGGFDDRFFMFMEDTDLSLRLHQSGYTNLVVPAAGGIHQWGAGSDLGRRRRLWCHHLSVWKYFLKHFPNGFSVILLPLLLTLNFCLRLILPHRDREGRV